MVTEKPVLVWLFSKDRMPTMMKFFDVAQVIRYGAVGVVVNGCGYLLFLLLTLNEVEYKLAASLLYVFGVCVSFFLNRKFVFRGELSILQGFIRHLIMVVGGYILNILMLLFFSDRYHYNPSYVQLVSIVVVSLYFYIFNKFFVHRNAE